LAIAVIGLSLMGSNKGSFYINLRQREWEQKWNRWKRQGKGDWKSRVRHVGRERSRGIGYS